MVQCVLPALLTAIPLPLLAPVFSVEQDINQTMINQDVSPVL